MSCFHPLRSAKTNIALSSSSLIFRFTSFEVSPWTCIERFDIMGWQCASVFFSFVDTHILCFRGVRELFFLDPMDHDIEPHIVVADVTGFRVCYT